MPKTAFLFPGQGSQKPGMGLAYHEETSIGRDLFERADSALGFPLSRLCFEGPAAELTRTENAQPAIFTVSTIAWKLLEERGIRAEAAAGHSLGEYSALVCAGVLTFEDGLRTVRRRGELMAEVGDRVRGAMAAVLDLPVEAVVDLCAEASAAGVVDVANFNHPKQTVLSGEEAGVERAMALAKERGGRATRLRVAAPFHSSLMAPLAAEMAGVLAALDLKEPRIPVVANVTADYVRTPDDVRAALVRQVAGSVRWTDCVRRLIADGFDTLIESGPGTVLTGLAVHIDPDVTALATDQALASRSGS